MKNDCFKVGVYIRLSKEDLEKSQNSESESIKNQRKLIYKYLKENDFNVFEEYIDDGYSGTNFNRPGFHQLIDDIEKHKINMVITKDLSRLGRDYIKTGYYIEDYFPTKKVRYISILDGIDTYQNASSNDIAPFKALFNDMVSKDTSKKIKSILKNKKEQGLFLGSRAPFGYKKDKHNKNKLVIDKKNSKIVKEVFRLSLEGKSNREIANDLNRLKVAPPRNDLWTDSCIYNILNNKEYTGCLISNVWTTISYKNKTKIKRNKEEWIIIEKTHPAIISKKMFEMVRRTKKDKFHNRKKGKECLLLDGLVFCSECGSKMGASLLKKRGYYILNCNRYKKNSTSCCSHYVHYSKLEKNVLMYLEQNIEKSGYSNMFSSLPKELLLKLIDKITITKDKVVTIKYTFLKN